MRFRLVSAHFFTNGGQGFICVKDRLQAQLLIVLLLASEEYFLFVTVIIFALALWHDYGLGHIVTLAFGCLDIDEQGLGITKGGAFSI